MSPWVSSSEVRPVFETGTDRPGTQQVTQSLIQCVHGRTVVCSAGPRARCGSSARQGPAVQQCFVEQGFTHKLPKKKTIIGKLDEPWESVGLEILHAQEENPSNTWTAKSFVWTEILRHNGL